MQQYAKAILLNNNALNTSYIELYDTITKPLLPPKAGYVEVIDENGEHVYQPTPETALKLEQEEKQLQLQDDIDSMLVNYEYRIVLLELGLNEQEEEK